MAVPAVGLIPNVIMLLVLGAGGFLIPTGVPPLDEDPALLRAAPAESLLFVEWFGIGEPSGDSTNPAVRLAANKEIRDLLDTVKSSIRRAVQAEAPGSARLLIDEGIQLLHLVASRPGCLFIADVSLPPERPGVRAGIIVNVGEKAADAGRSMRELENVILREAGEEMGMRMRTVDVGGSTFRVLPLPPPVPAVAWGFSGTYLILAVGDGMPQSIVKGLTGGTGLGGHEPFRAIQKQVAVDRPTSRSYINVAQVIEKAAGIGGPRVVGILSALGLNNVTAVVSESGLEADAFVSKGLIATRGISSGILRLVEGAPLTDDELAIIPRDATIAAAFRLNLETVYKEFLTALGSIDPEAREEFLKDMARGPERELRISVMDDLLRPLGDSWSIWNSPSQGGLVFTGLTAAVSVKDRDHFQRTFDRIVDAMRQEMGGSRRSRRGVFVDSFTTAGTKIYFINTVGDDVPLAPAWCLTDRHLLISLFPQMLKATVQRGCDVESSLARHPAVKDRGKALGLSFVDAAGLFRTLYPLLHPLAQLACSELQHEGIDITIAALPSAGGILPHLSCEVSTVERTDAGILTVSRGTLPNLGPIMGALVPGLLGTVTTAKAVSSSRHRVETVRMQAELRTLYQAVQMYQSDNGRYPDSLDALWSGDRNYIREDHGNRLRGTCRYYGHGDRNHIMMSSAMPIRGRRVILLGDGSSMTVPEAEFQERMHRQREQRQKAIR